MRQSPWSTELEFAIHTARLAGDQTLRAFHEQAFDRETKRDGSIVTSVDRATEQHIRHLCERAFPHDGMLGEEFGEADSNSGRRWIADPIDGTISFAAGVPLYGTLLALEADGHSRVGVIHMPALQETVYAAEGLGTWRLAPHLRAPQQVRFRACPALDQAIVCATDPAALTSLAGRAAICRGWSDCYAHVLAATGRVDAVIEPVVASWDIAPMTIIHREAGGRCTDYSNVETAHGGRCIVTQGSIHADLLAAVHID